MDNQHEKDLERIQRLRLIDDDFMTVCFDGNTTATELVLRIILKNEDISVEQVCTQQMLKSLTGRSLCLDIVATDSKNQRFDIEIQRSDQGAGSRRARYHSSLLDADMLKPGQDFGALRETYVIFITENDVLHGSRPVYCIDRYIRYENDSGNPIYEPFNDGNHIVYVNGAYREDDSVGKLMQDFFCTNPDDMNYKELADSVRYYKEDEKGVTHMCRMLEEMREEAAREATQKATREANTKTAINLLKLGKLSIEEIAATVDLSVDKVKELISPKTVQ